MNTAGFLHSFRWKTQPSSKQSHQQPKGFKMTTKVFSFKPPVESVLRTEILLKSLQEVDLIQDILKIQKVTFSGLCPGHVVTCCTKFRKNTSFLHPKMPNKIHPDRSAPMSEVLSSASVMSCFILFSSRDDGYGVLGIIQHLPNLGQSVQIFSTPAVALQGKRTYHWKSHTSSQSVSNQVSKQHRTAWPSDHNLPQRKLCLPEDCTEARLQCWMAGICWLLGPNMCPPKKRQFLRGGNTNCNMAINSTNYSDMIHDVFLLVIYIYIYIVCFCCCCCWLPWRNKICEKE